MTANKRMQSDRSTRYASETVAYARRYDENAIQFFDPDHSEDEDRFILLGTSFKLNTLVICHCFRENEAVIRIISARKADKDESKAYWDHKK